MKRVYVFLAQGFEEMEALGPVDILRRGGVEVLTVSITGADGKDFALAFYDHDESSYLLPITDSAAMLVSADDVDALIRMLRQRL